MSTPEQWELGGEIVSQGESHGSLAAIKASWDSVLERLSEVQRTSASLKKVGVGRTEDPTLIVARLVPALETHAEVVKRVAEQLAARLGGS